MPHTGRRIQPTEIGTCTSPSPSGGHNLRQVFPLNNLSQFWVTESGIAFEKKKIQGMFQWANGGKPTKLPNRVSTTWAIALAWTEPPDTDTRFPLRPIHFPNTEPLSPSTIAWTRCSSHRIQVAHATLSQLSLPEPDANEGTQTASTTQQWTPIVSFITYTHVDGNNETTKLASGAYEMSSSCMLRCNNAIIHAPLRTHLKGRPHKFALPEGSVFVHDVRTSAHSEPIAHTPKNTRSDTVYNCIVSAGKIDTICIGQRVGSMGNEQTIHSAVFNCVKTRNVRDIDLSFIHATTRAHVRAVCLEVMRTDPSATSTDVVTQLCTDQPACADEPRWKLYAEVRIARELVRKYEFDPPEGW